MFFIELGYLYRIRGFSQNLDKISCKTSPFMILSQLLLVSMVFRAI
jgi:hypothetical protein